MRKRSPSCPTVDTTHIDITLRQFDDGDWIMSPTAYEADGKTVPLPPWIMVPEHVSRTATEVTEEDARRIGLGILRRKAQEWRFQVAGWSGGTDGILTARLTKATSSPL